MTEIQDQVEEIPVAEILWEEGPPAIMAPAPPETPETPAPGRHRRESPTDSGREGVADESPPKRGRGRPRLSADEKASRARKAPPPTITARPPDFSEWHDYIGNFAIKWITRGYVAFAFRGIDRWDLLNEADNRALEIDETALSDIAKPLAHLADRSSLGKKYGRLIVDSSDGIIAMIQLGMWMNRVNRIAKKTRERLDNGGQSGNTEQVLPDSSGPSVSEPGQAPPSGFQLNGHAPGFGYN